MASGLSSSAAGSLPARMEGSQRVAGDSLGYPAPGSERPAVQVWGRLLPLFALLIAGCGGGQFVQSPAPGASSMTLAECRTYYDDLRQLIRREGVSDGEASPLDGFPYLRVNRFWASYAPEAETEESLRFWLGRLLQLGLEATAVEVGNLGRGVTLAGYARSDLRSTAEHCGHRLARHALGDPETAADIRVRASVRDDYSTLSRILGLYPLSSLLMREGAVRLQTRVGTLYTRTAREGIEGGVLYGPETVASNRGRVSGLLAAATERNPFRIPLPTPEEGAELLAAFAPLWEIGHESAADTPGRIVLGPSGPTVDGDDPVVYGYLSHTRFYGEALIQLNYVIWFPERPKRGAMDWYGGRFDGVVWRVTLDPDGFPLVYDSIHSCGCYHQVFPSARLLPILRADPFSEPLFVPKKAPSLAPGTGIRLRVRSGDHYLLGVDAVPRDSRGGRHYRLVRYDELRRLSGEQGSRSLFRPDGIIEGSERLERWLLWPAGIREPGAMRQRGRQPIAFVGRRHFDDASLMEAFFQRAPAKPPE